MINDLIFALLFSYFVIVPVFMFTFWDDKNKYFQDSLKELFMEKEIIELLMDTNIRMQDIANHYGVVRGAIFNIYSKLTWKNFTENIEFPKRYNNVKLNEENVIDICNLLNEKKLTDTQIGNIFGVNRKTINDIKLKKTWRKISNEIINF